MQLTAVLTPAEEGGFVALNPVAEALQNLQESTALYLEELPPVTQGHPLITSFDLPVHA